VLFMRLAILTAVLSIAALSSSTAYAAGYAEDGTYYSDADIEAAIHASFEPYDWATAEAVAYCESGYDPMAYNPALDTVGIFQISYIARVEYGLSYYDVDTPYENAYWANQMQNDLGWAPWACAY
jgi:hypothetical protein